LSEIFSFFTGTTLSAIVIIIIASISIAKAYKTGQVDAINGKIVYVLVKQPDGSTKWEHIK
jgi:hypothetical protein